MQNDKQYLTKEKLKELQKELDYLKSVKRKEIAENLQYAKSLGDLSENAEYHEARDAQAATEDRILQLESIIKNAQVIHAPKKGVVGVGSVVTIRREGERADREYVIVGPEEANTTEGKISYKSPIGEALMGKAKEDTAVCKTPSGEITCKIIDIK